MSSERDHLVLPPQIPPCNDVGMRGLQGQLRQHVGLGVGHAGSPDLPEIPVQQRVEPRGVPAGCRQVQFCFEGLQMREQRGVIAIHAASLLQSC
ncbi:hypothetical protein C8241_14495 [Paracidovorax avenae]|nr:hypothetical protein C8241_14495 [Paracidovorax avenae]